MFESGGIRKTFDLAVSGSTPVCEEDREPASESGRENAQPGTDTGERAQGMDKNKVTLGVGVGDHRRFTASVLYSAKLLYSAELFIQFSTAVG